MYTVRHRPGLGPRIDPSYDAEVGRLLASPSPGGARSTAGGYIELISRDGAGSIPPISAHEQLVALLAVFFDAPEHAENMLSKMRRDSAPLVWTQIKEIRYLTSDQEAGVALPLHSFNPPTDRERLSDAERKAALEKQLERLERITAGKLAQARVIGLTVNFDFGIENTRLRAAIARGAQENSRTPVSRDSHARVYRALFGGTPMHQLPEDIPEYHDYLNFAVSGGFQTQMKNAIRELRGADHAAASVQQAADYGITENGEGVIVGVVDFGCDFAHASFCSPDRRTSRILSLWDQNDGPDPSAPPLGAPMVASEPPVVLINEEPCSFGFGRVFSKGAIDQVLDAWRNGQAEDRSWPYSALGYDPHHNYYLSRRPKDAHGTCVLDIAAGSERLSPAPGGPTVRGVAWKSDIVFVQVRTHQEEGRRVLDANDVVDGVAYILHVADELRRPCVINLSLNTMSGPHDGDGHFERRLTHLMRSGKAGPAIKSRAVVVAAGNLPDKNTDWRNWQHIADTVRSGLPFEFFWNLQYERGNTRNSLEIWYDARDAWLQASLSHPNGLSVTVNPGRAAEILLADGTVVGSVVGSRVRPAIQDSAEVKRATGLNIPVSDHTPGRHVIFLSLDPHAGSKQYWTIKLTAVDGANAPVGEAQGTEIFFHAWLERDDEGQTGITRVKRDRSWIQDPDKRATIGTLSCGADPIVVSAYDASSAPIGCSVQSASGPTRLGEATKPDLSAPGVNIRLVRSKTDGVCGPPSSGTSLAAPFVTGTIACLYQVDRGADLATIKQALFETCRSGEPDLANVEFAEQLGHGRLSPRGAVDWLKQHPSAGPEPEAPDQQ
jgi:subtilisin family serine protease